MTQNNNPKVIAIAGASSGIGREIALEMAPDDHSFFLIGRNRERLEKVQNDVISLGGKACIGRGNIADHIHLMPGMR